MSRLKRSESYVDLTFAVSVTVQAGVGGGEAGMRGVAVGRGLGRLTPSPTAGGQRGQERRRAVLSRTMSSGTSNSRGAGSSPLIRRSRAATACTPMVVKSCRTVVRAGG